MLLEAEPDGTQDWGFAFKSAIWPLVPYQAQQLVRRLLRRGRPPAWIDPAFAARINLVDRLELGRAEVAFPSCEQRAIWREGTSGAMVHAMEATSRSGSRFGIEHSLPYMDRRIVEFGLALPAGQRWRDGRHKELLRRTMAPVVPPAIVGRRTNPSASHIYIQAIAAESPEGAEAPQSASERRGWVCGEQVRALRTHVQALYRSGDPQYAGPSWNVWGVVAMDLWLEAINVVQ